MEPRNRSRVRLDIEELKYRATPAVLTLMVAVVTALAALTVPSRVSAQGPTAPVWSIVIQTAPGLPQDVWVTGQGNNQDGWHGGGCLCLGPLAQGAGVTMHATVLTDFVSAGIYGVDGMPVSPGTYTLPGGQLLTDGRTGPAEIVGPREYTIASGKTFFVVFDAYVVESNLDQFGIPKGLTTKFLFTFDFDPSDPDSYGNTQRYVANWLEVPGVGFIPFLNEGVLMTNVQLRD
jgi:hypothetical protein